MVALMSVMTDMPFSYDGSTPPDWVHILPHGAFPVLGGRTSLRASDLKAVIEASLQRGKIVLDENHSTDLAAPRGKPSPAMGWIEAMEARSDGLWGRVVWTKRGRAAMEDHAYRALSPVLSSLNGEVTQILRVSLTNTPDLTLTTLHSQTTNHEGCAMTYSRADLCARLGLKAEADDATIAQALDQARGSVSLHSRTAELAGLKPDASEDAILASLQAQREQITLHSTATQSLQSRLDALEQENGRIKAERFVSEAGRTKLISDDLRGTLITLHSQNAELAQSIVAGLPDAPSGQPTMGGAAGASHARADTGMAKAEAALGLTEDDLKQGGLR